MRKLRNFLGVLACFCAALALVLVLASCKDTAKTPSCNHVWDWVETKPPTATEAGEETYTCLLCGQTGIKRAKSAIPTVINSVTISITAPVNGVTPNTAAYTNDTGYTLGAITWSPVSSKFLGGTAYTASLTLTANSGYTFSGLNSATVNGQGATISNSTSSTVTLSYVFPATDTKTVTSIAIKTQPTKLTYTHGDSLDLTGLAVTLTHDDTTTEDVSASDFASKNITASPAQGDSLVYPTHNGQPVTITYGNLTPQSTNNLTVNPKTIANVEISVTAPVKSATPDATVNGTGDFTIGAVTWSPADSLFLGGTVYTVSFTLIADSGYTFSGLSSATINGQNATVSNNGTAVTLSYTFPSTDTKTVTGMAIKTQPTKLTYTHGDQLDLTGLAVTLTHDDTTTEDVSASDFASKNITANPADGNHLVRSTHNGQPVTITYGELTQSTNNLTVNAKSISSLTFDPTSFPAQTYNGNPHTPTVTVKDGTTTLTLNTDYTVTYTNNTNVGTATVRITGAGNYSGSRDATFAINKAAGAAVSAPTAATIGVNSVTLNAVSASTGQSVEYARNSTNTAPSSGWQTGTTFSSLTAGTAYFFARSAQNDNYNAGTASASLTIVTGLIEMVQVPGGSFQMGNSDSSIGNSDERPVHTVTLTGFYMGKYEVTQAQYQAVMGRGAGDSFGAGGNYPMYHVGWYEALVFCNKLSVMEGLTPAYRINNSTDPAVWGNIPLSSNSTWNAVEVVSGSTGYRLPTEAQWEYAARGGNGSPGNYIYSGSNNADDVAWYWDNIPSQSSGNPGFGTQPVGTKAPNGLGLYDMSGNVAEFCWDWYGSYSSGAQTDPVGASAGPAALRVTRGGFWIDSAEFVRSASRLGESPYSRDNSRGFRLVRP